jgi:hypothetical protein
VTLFLFFSLLLLWELLDRLLSLLMRWWTLTRFSPSLAFLPTSLLSDEDLASPELELLERDDEEEGVNDSDTYC